MDTQIDDGKRLQHWQKSKALMIRMMVLWFVFSFVIHGFVIVFNNVTIPVLNFKLGYYLAGQGSLIVFVIMIFVFARRQNAIDVETGVAEKDE
ncbi:hypothetical protein COTS27_01207 [Spirochaetota bacterium]|nr:hypothetical protein COTS27_01207 [Spirochaetota bacterium]